MTTPGAVPLSEVAARTQRLVIACSRCVRRGRYTTARLVATYGADFPLTDLGAELANCTRRSASAHHERCDVYFPELVAILHGGNGTSGNSANLPASPERLYTVAMPL